MNTTTHHPAKTKSTYISNPFKSSFDGLSRIFKVNQTPAIIILVISFFGSIFNSFGSFPMGGGSSSDTSTATSSASSGEVAAIVAFILSVVLVVIAVSIFIGVLYSGVVNYVAWKSSRNEETNLGEAFSKTFKRFWRILLIQTIVGLKVFGGTLLFIVPGIRAALRYQMVYFAMFDEDLDAWKSMNRVKELTNNHLMEVFGIMTVSQLLFPVAVLIQMGGHGVLYPQLKHLKDNNLPKPKTHWLNYLGFLLLAGFLAFLALMIAVLIAFTQV